VQQTKQQQQQQKVSSALLNNGHLGGTVGTALHSSFCVHFLF
jgi:hypothetical protein